MKVIGVAGYCYIVEMHGTELGHLTGNDTYREADQKYVGKELQIRKPWDTIRELQKHQAALPQMANKLRALADLLEPIAVEIPVVE